MRKNMIFTLCAVLALAIGCTDVKNEPINKGDGIPEKVTDVKWKPIAGGADISYTLPADASLLYVEAVYTLQSGEVKNVKASFYQNSLQIIGLADTDPCRVELYSVGRNEHRSEPIELEIVPLDPPVQTVFKSLSMEETFGGIRVRFDNESEANVVITVVTRDEEGVFIPAETYYTKRAKGDFAARGFRPEKREFGVFVRDQWLNLSDTLFMSLTPVYEEELDKSKFRKVDLDGCTHTAHVGSFEGLWDGSTGNIFHTKPGSGLPQWFNFDTGVTSVLSRFRLHHRPDKSAQGVYNGGDPKIYEIWGSNDPDKDGGWDNWVLLGTFESTKPSGTPTGTLTSEDYQFACVDGEDFDFPSDIPPVRYLRFKINKVWGALDHMYIAELTFWGGGDQSK